jgi:hypothetical protein
MLNHAKIFLVDTEGYARIFIMALSVSVLKISIRIRRISVEMRRITVRATPVRMVAPVNQYGGTTSALVISSTMVGTVKLKVGVHPDIKIN